MTAASASQSVPLFVGWCLIGGIAYSLTFTGGLGLVNRLAPDHHRGAFLSLLYLLAYTLQAPTAIIVGALATNDNLAVAVAAGAGALAALCLIVIALLSIQTITLRCSRA